MLRATSALILVLDRSGSIIYFNPACEETTGFDGDEILGDKLWDHLDDADVAGCRDAFLGLVRSPIPVEHESRWVAKDGGFRTIVWDFRAIVDDQGVFDNAFVSGVDITVRRQAERTLAKREASLELIMESLPIGHYTADWDDERQEVMVTSANAFTDEIIGRPISQTVPSPLIEHVHDDDIDEVLRAIGTILDQRIEAGSVVRVVRPDGAIRWVRSRGAPVIGKNGDVIGGVGWLLDITAEVEAVGEAEYLSHIIDAATDLVLVLEPDGTVRYANPAAVTMLGRRPEHVRDILDEESGLVFGTAVSRALESGIEWRGEMTIVTGTGDKLPVSQLFLAHRNVSHALDRISMIARDISASKEREQHLSHMAFHDVLTGLPNRSLVVDRLTQALDRSTRSQDHVAVMFLDLDYFKSVNDELGHEAGDQLLRLTAGRLKAAVRPGDTVSRLGGDEFVIICEAVADSRESLQIAERIRTSMARPFTIGNTEVKSSASIGVAIAKDDSVKPTDLLTQADTAAYQAKARGRNRYEQYRANR